MNRNTWYLTTSRFAFTALFAAGMAGAPLELEDGALSPNGAAAQSTDAQDAGASPDNGTGTGDIDSDGAAGASEDGEGEAQERLHGSQGSFGAVEGQLLDPAVINTNSAEMQEYSAAAERGDLEEAAAALADAVDAPVTEEYVDKLNQELEVQTSLTSSQIAEAANEDEKLPY